MMAADETILITGGMGFIGLHLAEVFFREGFKVVVLDRAERNPGLPDSVRHIRGSVTDKDTWFMALAGVDTVIHLAAYMGRAVDHSNYLSVNAAGTAFMYEVIAEHKLPVKKVIVASSQEVYGEGRYRCEEHGIFYPERRKREDLVAGKWDVRCPACGMYAYLLLSEEDDKLNAVSMYGVSKIAADHTARLLGDHYEIPTIVVRNSLVIGAHPLMTQLYPGSALPYCAAQTLKNEPMEIPEDGQQLRDMITISDLGAAYRVLVRDTRAMCGAVNVCGETISLTALGETICRIAGVSFRPVYVPALRPWRSRHWMMSRRKITGEFGWQPLQTIEDGVEEYLALARTML